TIDALTRGGLRTDVVLRVRGPLGPVLRARRRALEARGRLGAGQQTEELVVVRGQSSEGSRGCRRP
ncbi:MAG TPA: hypothetical protein VNS09_05360, partial [Solirubrobacter sp.]|nr:hypothetical protein [Solirubrobacter sp.]